MNSRRYRATFYESLGLGADRFLIYVPGTEKRFLLSSIAQEVLQRCKGSRALEAHLSRISGLMNVPASGWSLVKEALDELLDKGLLVEESSLITSISSSSIAEVRERSITSLAFLTADRTAQLQRSLASYSENYRSYGRQVEIIVMDDSRSEASRRQSLQCLRHTEGGRPVQYGGSKEKLSYIGELARQGIDPAIARFAMLGTFGAESCTTGANRNCVLLDTVGELVLMADDDTICKIVPHPQRDGMVKFGGHEIPREAWFYNTREEVSASAKCEPCDLLGEHERMLGKRLVNIISQTPANRVDIATACKHLLAGLQHGDAKVVFTMTGMAGDSGAGCAQNVILSSKRVLAELNENEAAFQRALASREVLWVARSQTITHSVQCQAAGLGLANGELLPPFFPIGRNEDGVFGSLNLLLPTSFQGHVPVALLHDALPGRQYQRLPPFRMANLILSLVAYTAPAQNRTMQTTLRSIGRSLLEISAFPGQEFWDSVFTAVSRSHARTVRMLQLSSRRVTNCSPYLQAEIEKYQEHIFASLTARNGSVPEEFHGLPPELARERTRELVQIAGHLFFAWPDLVAAARDLKRKGMRLTKSVTELSD